MKKILLLLIVSVLSYCTDKIVDESYASLYQKSINGVDAFTALLEDKASRYISKSNMSNLVLDDADLVVYFNKSHSFYDDELLYLESYLQRVSPDELSPENELKEEAESVFWEGLAGRSIAAASKIKKSSYLFSEDEKNKTILFFLMDTDSSVPFYERVMHDLKESKLHQDYIYKFLLDRRSEREQLTQDDNIPFSQRLLLYHDGPLIHDFIQNIEALPTPLSFFPVRYVPGPVQAYYTNKPATQSLLSTRGGDLIRVHYFEKVRFIMIYNSEPFLNYALVRPEFRQLAKELINYAVRGIQKPVIAYISDQLVPVSNEQNDKNESLFKILLVYPINILLIQFGLFLVFFLLHKWPQKSHPLPLKRVGSRTFMEHFIALGTHLKGNQDKDEILKNLIQYRKKRGFQSHQDPNNEENND